MRVYKISAITLKVKEMGKTCDFYSRIPGFRLVYGGTRHDTFTTYEIGEEEKEDKEQKTYLNIELARETIESEEKERWENFGRIIFHTDNVDSLYRYMKHNKDIS